MNIKQQSCFKGSNNKDIKEPIMAEKIEILIQKMYNITIPSIIFEYISNKDADFEINDLKNFYTSFGEVIDFIIKDKISIVLYKTFFSANACREFLLNENNFKENMKKNFSVRWFDYEKDMNTLPNDLQKIFKEIHNKNISNLNNNNNKQNEININNKNLHNNNEYQIKNNLNIINDNNINNNFLLPQNLLMQYNQNILNQPLSINNIQNMNNINSNNNINDINMKKLELMNLLSNINDLSNNISIPSQLNIPLLINNQNNLNINNIMDMNFNVNNINNYQNFQIQNNNFQSKNYEEKNYGRYTCKYQILLQNDNDFQIARRLIGSKGYNMKKILNECKNNNNDKDNVKLRLRGRGSGFKEGPENKESDEPLHLCISAKNQEEMNKACILVENLLNKIYEDYKIYCLKNNKLPAVNQLAIRIDEGNTNKSK